MATIRKLPSGNYQAIVRLAKLKPIRRTFNTKRDALAFSRTVEGDAKLSNALGNPVLHSLTLAHLIDSYLQQFTGKDHNVIYRLRYWRHHYGKLPLKDFTSETIRNGIKSLNVKPQTTNRYKANLSSVFKYAIGENRIKDNPCSEIVAKPESKGRTRYFSPDEQHKLLTAAKVAEWDRLHLLILMALKTGARRSELLHLTWDKINFSDKTALLIDTKNGSQRVLPLTPDVITQLKRFRGINGLIFAGSVTHLIDGKPVPQPFDFRYQWANVTKSVGLSGIGFHTCRHTFCSNLAMAGCSLIEIAEAAGHKSLQSTMRYSHLCTKHKAAMINRVFG